MVTSASLPPRLGEACAPCRATRARATTCISERGGCSILFGLLSLWTLSWVRSSRRSAMPVAAWAETLSRYAKRWWPEALLAVLVLGAFLGCLGSVELWGKREQRAAAEAIDTVEHNHWLVAEIQGRPRLEKP